ncbi:MAG: hypothetical protein JKY37_29755 [Nannocystaceae bacterium]|nr:hypothetical protein [Nannocystaceae bacterium]
MRIQRTLRGGSTLPLASLLAATMLVPVGCDKVEELAAKVKGEEVKEESKDEPEADDAKKKDEDSEPAEKAEVKPEDNKADPKVDPTPVVEAEIEPVPVEELHAGLDLMLKFVPNDKAEFMIVRDATVLADYIEQGMRFVDGPLAKLSGADVDADLKAKLGDVFEAHAEIAKFHEKLRPALEDSGMYPKEGMALIKDGSASYFVFNAEDPMALNKFATALDPEFAEETAKCKAIPDTDGWNVCTSKDKDLEAYARSEDPGPLRATLTDLIPGIELEDANLILHIKEGPDAINAAVTTMPGSLHLALAPPAGDDNFKEIADALSPGEAKTLANVKPGAGFVWGHVNPKVLADGVAGMGGAPPPVKDFANAMTGDFVFAGSVDPGGIVIQAGISDASKFAPLLALGEALKDSAPKELPEFGNAKMAVEKVAIEGGGKQTDAMHVALTGIPEADILKSYTGLHMDAWAFASGEVFTVAVGPNSEGVGKFMDTAGSGPSAGLLAALPTALADGLRKKEVSFAMHLPMDFLHGKQLRDLATAGLKAAPDVKAEQLLQGLGMLASFSSASMWIAQPDGKLVLHMSVQGIGNTETEEGKVALAAAQAVANGANPEAEFGPIATKYAASPMAYAYKARAGTDGPGYMVGSGVGAAMAVALVAVPVVLGQSNAALADDLGVKPDDPEPEVIEVVVPKAPKITKKKAEPKKPKKPKTPKKEDPKDPVVEPDRPLPPKPTPDAPDPKAEPKKDPRRPRRPRRPSRD